MRTVYLGFVLAVLCLVGTSVCRGEEVLSLPFPVKIGGQAATADKNAVKATVAEAVANDAELEVGAQDTKMIIVNFWPCDEKGALKEGGTAAILILQDKNKGPINKTMDNKPLAAGTWQANVVADGKTAMVVFKVK